MLPVDPSLDPMQFHRFLAYGMLLGLSGLLVEFLYLWLHG